MCSDARREINHLEVILLKIVNQSMEKLISRETEVDENILKCTDNSSEEYRRIFEQYSFNGLRNLKKCLSCIQEEFESYNHSKLYVTSQYVG